MDRYLITKHKGKWWIWDSVEKKWLCEFDHKSQAKAFLKWQNK